ncbi:MAG TPA: CAP domain-containing protein [Gaiellaceae bacterium]
MRSRTLLALVVGGILFLASAPGALSSDLVSQAQLSGQEQSLLNAINRARARHGAPPLRIAAPLQRAARSHSNAMLRTGSFTHGDWYRRLRRHGARGRTLGETIAWGTGSHGTAASIVRMWLGSPPHRATLLRRGFRYVGVGVATGTFSGYGGASIATADFAGR